MAQSNPHPTVSPYVVGTATNGLVLVAFRVQASVADGTDPDNVIPAGAVTAATSTATGEYSVTLANYTKYAGFISGHITVMSADSETTGKYADITSYTASTGVLVFEIKDSSADPAGAYVVEDGWILVTLVMALNAADVTSTAI